MSEVGGDIREPVGTPVLENWLRQSSQQARDDGISGVTERERPNRSNIAENGQEGQNTQERSRTGPKRTLKDYLIRSPRNATEKRMRCTNGSELGLEKDFLSIDGLKRGFKGAKSKIALAQYVFSAAYVPLRYMTVHAVGDVAFKPYYCLGLPVYDLHCTAVDCNKVTRAEEMADAAIRLLSRLSASDLRYLGIVTERRRRIGI